jgi:hypothetical protein
MCQAHELNGTEKFSRTILDLGALAARPEPLLPQPVRAEGHDHPLSAALRDLDVGSEPVGRSENIRRVAVRMVIVPDQANSVRPAITPYRPPWTSDTSESGRPLRGDRWFLG